jgi:hypothetical protein
MVNASPQVELLEDKIAKIIKEIYDGTGFHDEGRSDQAAHEIIKLLDEAIEHRRE